MLTNTIFSRWFSRSTPEKRLNEIEGLSSANPEHLSRLRALSADSDPQVRLAAARGIGLRDQLCKLLLQETDDSVRREIIADLFNDVDAATARETAALLARHTPDSGALRKLIFELTSADAVGALIQQSGEDSLAMDVASGHRISAIRVAAAGQITDAEQLQHIARSARDKSVQQLVRSKVREHRDTQAEQNERNAQIDRLISNSAKLIESVDTADYAARLQVLHEQAEQLSAHIDDDKRHIIDRNLRRCSQRAAALPQGSPPPVNDEPDTTAARETALDAPQPTTDPEPPPPVTEPESQARTQTVDALASEASALDLGNALDCEHFVQDATARWDALADEPLSSETTARFESVLATARSASACHQLLDTHSADIHQLISTPVDHTLDDNALSEAQDNLAEWLAQLDWPDRAPAPPALSALLGFGESLAREHAARKDAKVQLARKLDRQIYRLRGQVQRKQLKAALHSERDIDALLTTADEATRDTVERKLASARKELEQLRDWDNFRADPLREALCERLEALGASPLPPDAQAEAVKAARQEWRTINTAPLAQDNPVQQRYQAAADAAFAHCAEWHERQQAVRQRNLHERERLVSELQQFVDSLDTDNADVDILQRAMRASRDEWHHYQPVRHSDAKACQKQFDRLLDRLHQVVKNTHKRNKHARSALIERAEALMQLDDLDQAINQAIALQTEWKAIGPVAHRDQRQQWARFRKPMDALFAQRSAARDAVKAESNAQLSTVQNWISELRALADDNSQPLAQRIRAAEDIREQIGQILTTLSRRDADRMAKDADAQLKKLHEAKRDAPRQRQVAHLQLLLSARRALCALDAAHSSGDGADAAAVSAEFAEQFGENSSARALLDQRLAAFAHPHDDALARQHTETLGNLLIELEILTDLPTPDAWRAERRACQIEMLEDRQNANTVAPDHIQQLLAQALLLGPVGPDAESPMPSIDAERRLEALVAAAPRWLS